MRFANSSASVMISSLGSEFRTIYPSRVTRALQSPLRQTSNQRGGNGRLRTILPEGGRPFRFSLRNLESQRRPHGLPACAALLRCREQMHRVQQPYTLPVEGQPGAARSIGARFEAPIGDGLVEGGHKRAWERSAAVEQLHFEFRGLASIRIGFG